MPLLKTAYSDLISPCCWLLFIFYKILLGQYLTIWLSMSSMKISWKQNTINSFQTMIMLQPHLINDGHENKNLCYNYGHLNLPFLPSLWMWINSNKMGMVLARRLGLEIFICTRKLTTSADCVLRLFTEVKQ